MKKVYLTLLFGFSLSLLSYGQRSDGGFPESTHYIQAQNQEVATLQFDRPNYEAIMLENEERERKGISGPYMVSTMVNASINPATTGTWIYLEDGKRIWRVQVEVPDAKGLGFLFDSYSLPKGAKLFMTNANGRHILGGFTAVNNAETGTFATEAVQGSIVTLELDLDAGVSASDVKLNINQVAAYYRGVSDLDVYANASGGAAARPTQGESAPCHLNANCAIPTSDDYTIPKKATCRIVIQGGGEAGGFCSGTLINNTGNTPNGTCLPYILTASHCDGSNSFENARFQQWVFRFNYRTASCEGTSLEGTDQSGIHNSLVGASFKARSYYPSLPGNSNSASRMVADFLLLEASEPVTNIQGGAYLAGWNRSAGFFSDDQTYDFYIGYHHPSGDVEKVSYGFLIQPNGTFNQQTVSSTHWYIPFTGGGSQPGSSGSGLFDVYGRLIGDLSGGTNSGCQNNPSYANFGREGLYSKLSYAWENEYDQANHSNPDVKKTRLKDWLDPLGGGDMFLHAASAVCDPLSISEIGQELEQNIKVYPNPSSNGILKVSMNLTEVQNFTVSVYNALGQKVKSFTLAGAYDKDYTFDCSDLADGMYLLQFVNSKGNSVSKKALISR